MLDDLRPRDALERSLAADEEEEEGADAVLVGGADRPKSSSSRTVPGAGPRDLPVRASGLGHGSVQSIHHTPHQVYRPITFHSRFFFFFSYSFVGDELRIRWHTVIKARRADLTDPCTLCRAQQVTQAPPRPAAPALHSPLPRPRRYSGQLCAPWVPAGRDAERFKDFTHPRRPQQNPPNLHSGLSRPHAPSPRQYTDSETAAASSSCSWPGARPACHCHCHLDWRRLR